MSLGTYAWGMTFFALLAPSEFGKWIGLIIAAARAHSGTSP